MKFLCDRCKTRYSIGDERVRGKILKIRCKHCSNVITVREGMQVDDGSVVGPLPSDPSRPKKSTTIAPEALDERNASGLLNVASVSNAPSIAVAKRTAVAADNALGAAFASAMAPSIAAAAAEAKPPAALEEEWYVSIDGDQSGPFLLADAQRWIAAKPFEADLHCWSEGFDDWLPVDKVSHFRGLRKRPVPPPAPPPAPVPTIPRTISPRASAGLGPSVAQAAPSVARTPTPVAAPASELPARPNASPAFGTAVAPRSNGAAPLPHATPDQRFDDVPDTAPLRDSGASAVPVAAAAEVATVPTAPPAAAPDDGFTGDDDLDIGEVSRVVNLADLMRNSGPVRRGATGASPRVGGATGANPRLTGSQPVLRATGAHAAFRGTGAQSSLSGPVAAPMSPSASGPFAAPTLGGTSGPVGFSSASAGLDAPAPGIAGPDGVPPVATSHRRGLIALLGVAAVLVIGVIIVLAVFVASTDDTTGGSLGRVNNIDTSRPDDPITHRPTGPTPGPGSGSAIATPGPTVPHGPIRRPNPPPTRDPEPLTPAADSLRSDEIEDIARKHQDTTQRCYMRSQRGADAILVGDVKKIAVTLQIEKDGSVVDVQLSDHAADTLGKCLATSIRGWKFRTSAGGRFRFSLNFVSG